jgi:four helix bundle protein
MPEGLSKASTMRNDLEERLLDFGARVIRLVEALPKSLAGRRLGDQLLRSGTSVGANFEEAQAAESKDDFVHKLQVALKEARESTYWLRLIARSKLVKPELVDSLTDESQQIRAILSKSVATVKGRAK